MELRSFSKEEYRIQLVNHSLTEYYTPLLESLMLRLGGTVLCLLGPTKGMIQGPSSVLYMWMFFEVRSVKKLSVSDG